MGIRETALIYAVIGLALAVAVVLREDGGTAGRRALLFVGAAMFWPLFAPLVFAAAPRQPPAPRTDGALRGRIEEAQVQLLASLARVDGIAEEVLAPEIARIRALAGGLGAMERRLAEMDELLAGPEFDERAARGVLESLVAQGHGDDDPRVQSVRSRLRNLERLRAMRTRTAGELERVLLKLQEMSSQLLLLKFAGRPEAEVVRTIKEIAETVEGITEGVLAAG